MTKKAGWGLIAGGAVFLTGALWPMAGEGEPNWMLLVLALVFLVVGLKKATASRTRTTGG